MFGDTWRTHPNSLESGAPLAGLSDRLRQSVKCPKAQGQCKATWEAVEGMQGSVVEGEAEPAKTQDVDSENELFENLLRKPDAAEMDAGAAKTPGQGDPSLEAVEEDHGAKVA